MTALVPVSAEASILAGVSRAGASNYDGTALPDNRQIGKDIIDLDEDFTPMAKPTDFSFED